VVGTFYAPHRKEFRMPRPYVICHMCTTIDGKVLSRRWPKLPGAVGAASLFETTAATFGIPAWLVGTTTMKEFMGRNLPLKKAKRPVPSGDFVAETKPKGLAIGTDAKGVLRFQENEVEGDHVVLLITNRASRDYRAALRDAGVSYLICGSGKQVDLRVALEKLHRVFKLKKLMLQGGGTFNGAMLAAGLVDEISQVIVPAVDGGGPGVTGVFDAPEDEAPAKGFPLRVVSHKALPRGVHWFRYRVGGTR
jgi:riboflavin biosynthesis pyrimidine reductase